MTFETDSSLFTVQAAEGQPGSYRSLISADGDGFLQPNPQAGYRIRPRFVHDLLSLFRDCDDTDLASDWDADAEAYAEAESATHPDITCVAPRSSRSPNRHYYGSTLGQHTAPNHASDDVLKVCECTLGCAALLVDRRGTDTIELFPMRPGEMVGVPGDAILTRVQLGDRPAVLLDVGNHGPHAESAPPLLLWSAYQNLRARINRRFVDRDDGYGVRHPRTLSEVALPVASNSPEEIHRCLMSPCGARIFGLRGIAICRPDPIELARSLGLHSRDLPASIESLRKDRPGDALRDYLFRPAAEEGSMATFGGGAEVTRSRI